MDMQKCFRRVPLGEGLEYSGVEYYDAPPGTKFSHTFSTPLAAQREFCRLFPWDEKNIEFLEEMWEEDVIPFLEKVYGKRE